MFNVYVEMPSGARSRGYEYEDREAAEKAFEIVVNQLKLWPNFVADVYMRGDGEIRSVEIANA